jgi:hypothetical protein
MVEITQPILDPVDRILFVPLTRLRLLGQSDTLST